MKEEGKPDPLNQLVTTFCRGAMTERSGALQEDPLYMSYAEIAAKYVSVALTLILRRSHMGMVWFYTSTSNKRAARPKLYTKSLTGDLKRMYSRFTLVRISIKL